MVKEKNWYTYEEAQARVRELGIITSCQYKEDYKKDPRLPHSPEKVYRSQWVYWDNFFKREKKVFYTYEEASECSQKLGFKDNVEYQKGYKVDPHLPSNPSQHYREQWKNWFIFLNQQPPLTLISTTKEGLAKETGLDIRLIRRLDSGKESLRDYLQFILRLPPSFRKLGRICDISPTVFSQYCKQKLKVDSKKTHFEVLEKFFYDRQPENYLNEFKDGHVRENIKLQEGIDGQQLKILGFHEYWHPNINPSLGQIMNTFVTHRSVGYETLYLLLHQQWFQIARKQETIWELIQPAPECGIIELDHILRTGEVPDPTFSIISKEQGLYILQRCNLLNNIPKQLRITDWGIGTIYAKTTINYNLDVSVQPLASAPLELT